MICSDENNSRKVSQSQNKIWSKRKRWTDPFGFTIVSFPF
jgi:hypothetical protein